MDEMSETESDVKEVPRSRWELSVDHAVCSRSNRTRFCIAVGTAVWVGRAEMYASKALTGLLDDVDCGDMIRSRIKVSRFVGPNDVGHTFICQVDAQV